MINTGSAIILDGKKILLVKRVPVADLFPNCWCIPGGKEEPGEVPEETVVRETKEEVNLDFKPQKLFMGGRWKDRNLHRYLGEWSGRIKLQLSELIDYGWFTYDEAIHLDFAFDYRWVIERLKDEGYL